MIKENPLISILMPVYNTEQYLEEAILSVLNQTYPFWELICVDDGSTDRCPEILRTYMSLDKRITVVHQRNSGTASAARNTALDHAKGQYIQMLDSDDLLSADCLEKSFDVTSLTKADLVIPEFKLFEGPVTNIIREIIGYRGEHARVISSLEAFIASLRWEISGVGLFRSTLLKTFRYDESGMNGDEYSTRLLLLNCNKVSFSEGIYYYRQHHDSTTQKISERRFDTLLTDIRLLELSKEYNAGTAAIDICKEKFVQDLISCYIYFLKYKKNFNDSQRDQILSILKFNFAKVDRSFLKYEGRIIGFLGRQLLFTHFEFLKFYAFLKTNKPGITISAN